MDIKKETVEIVYALEVEGKLFKTYHQAQHYIRKRKLNLFMARYTKIELERLLVKDTKARNEFISILMADIEIVDSANKLPDFK